MVCPNCGSRNPEGARFCSSCGTALSVACTNCGAGLSPSAKFCSNCGQPVLGSAAPTVSAAVGDAPAHERDTLSAASAVGGAPGRLEQYIPRELLGKLEAARSTRSMAGERRTVTVLFCDVKGSTSIAERLDPEEWAEIMNGAFEHLIAPVYKYEGTLARLMGDAILAFFGAPIAHEDDPQRAVLAGLGMVEGMKGYREKIKRERGFDLSVRVGINTGLVVVGEVGSDLRVEYTAMGDAVNLASRMEQSADPDTVRVSGNTYKSVSNLFRFRSLGEVEVRGKTEPVAAYEVLGVREGAVPTRGIEGLSSPLVGRRRELQQLRDALRAVEAGLGQVVSVIGEAGLGKSRLMSELRREAGVEPAARGQAEGFVPAEASRPVLWLEGRSLSYETSTPYAPFVDLLSSYFGLHAADSNDQKYARIVETLERDTPGLGAAPFLATLLGVRLEGEPKERVKYLEPPALRARLFQSVGGLLGALAAARPVVVVLEDLHWADATSLDLLERLLPLTESAPLMIAALFRPNAQDASWRFHELAAADHAQHYTSVSLQPLDDAESRQLVANLLEIEDLPEKVRALILKKAEGNPFFVEEVIRSLLDAGLVVRADSHWRATREIENIAVPDTLGGVITARLDRLDDESKYVAQTAAVIGREFQDSVLRDVYEAPLAVDTALATLERRELIREKPAQPRSSAPVADGAGRRSHLFKHVLTQETAYASVLLSRRRTIHLKVAECLERTEPERVNEIARHLLEARQDARALPYLVETGDRAARSGARDEATTAYRRAIEIARAVDDHVLARRAYEGLGKTLEFSMNVPGALESYNEMLAFARLHEEVPMQVSALNKLSYVTALMLGQMPEAEQLLGEAESLARSQEEKGGLVEAVTVRCSICAATGDFASAAIHLREAARLGRDIDDKNTTAFGLAHRAQMLMHLAQFDEAYETALEGLAVAGDARNLERKAEILTYTIPMYHLHLGNFDEARRLGEEGYAIAARIGATYSPIVGSFTLGSLAFMQGDYERALTWMERCLEHARPLTGFLPFLTVMPLGGLGSVCLAISEAMAGRVIELHKEALQLLQTPLGAPAGGTGWADLGFCALELGHPELAGEYFRRGLEHPSIQMHQQRPRLLAGAALAALALGHLDEAAGLAREAEEFVVQKGMKHFAPLVSLAAGHVSGTRGDPGAALEKYRSAESLALEMSLRPVVLEARLAMAELYAQSGRTGDAGLLRQQAEDTVAEMTSLFDNDEHRELFNSSSARRTTLSAGQKSAT